MELELVPLLQTQRDLYRIPRGRERFDAYLRTMVNADGSDLRLPPLVSMNPMGKDHVPVLLDALLALDADGIAAHAVAEASSQLVNVPGELKVGLVVADDAAGGWTNRLHQRVHYALRERTLSQARLARRRLVDERGSIRAGCA